MATERGVSIKKGINKQGWEESEFPVVCETCLGDNPYIRMMKQNHGDQCRICQKPYTVFRWKAGTKGRFKRTEICQTCAKVKNVCQTCIFDLQYGLPVQVRDKFMGENKVALPQSIPNRDYWIQQQTDSLGELQLPYNDESLNPLLMAQAKLKPKYDRNKAKVCSFWEKNECTRGDLCPYSHEKRHDKESSLAKQNIRDRFHGNNDPLAKSILDKILDRQETDITPPDDISITSIFLKNLPANINDQELSSIFSQYGNITSIKILSNQFIAFINYASRKSAQDAVQDNYGNLIIKGNKIQCTWARSQGYKSVKNREELQYVEELNELNQMIDPANIPRPPQMPHQPSKEAQNAVTNKKLQEILNQKPAPKQNLLDYSDDENEQNQQQENKPENGEE